MSKSSHKKGLIFGLDKKENTQTKNFFLMKWAVRISVEFSFPTTFACGSHIIKRRKCFSTKVGFQEVLEIGSLRNFARVDTNSIINIIISLQAWDSYFIDLCCCQSYLESKWGLVWFLPFFACSFSKERESSYDTGSGKFPPPPRPPV